MDTDKKTSICILAPVHPAFDVRVFSKEAVSLADAGFDVALFARAEREETRSGVRIKPLAYRNRLHRFFMQPVWLWRVLRERADVYHLHNPDTIFIGVLLKLFGKKVIYDTHEDFVARIPTKLWIPKPLRWILAHTVNGLEYLISRVADCVIVTQTHQVAKFKGVLIENYPRIDDAQIADVHRRAAEIDKGNDLRLIYVGEINALRGLQFLLDVMEDINKRQPARLWITGTDHNEGWLARLSAHPAWNKYVDYLGYLEELNSVFAYISKADFGAALFEDVGDLERISSNKVYEYQTYGTPFVATALSSRYADIGGKGGGLFVQFGDVETAAREIERAYADRAAYEALVEKGKQMVFKERNWSNEERKLLAVYADLIS